MKHVGGAGEARSRPEAERDVDDGFSPVLDSNDDVVCGDCVPTVLAVTVCTPRDRYADPETATQDVAGVIRTALDRDFLDVAAVRVDVVEDPQRVASTPRQDRGPRRSTRSRVGAAALSGLLLVGLALAVVGAIGGACWLAIVGVALTASTSMTLLSVPDVHRRRVGR